MDFLCILEERYILQPVRFFVKIFLCSRKTEKVMKVNKQRKIIGFLLIITMLIYGMCFDNNVESYSFLLCENSYDLNITPISEYFLYNTTISADVYQISLEQMYVHQSSYGQEFITSVSRNFLRNRIISFRSDIEVLCFASMCLLLFLYYLLWDFCGNLQKIYCNIVIIGYIHQQDGEKAYSI